YVFTSREGLTNSIPATAQGVYRTTNGGATWTQRCNFNAAPTTCPFGSTGNNSLAQIRATPGVAGDLWYVQGATFNVGSGAGTGGSGNGHPSSCTPGSSAYACLWHSTDGGATWGTISTVSEPQCVGLGKPVTGGYPAVYIYGWVGGVGGIWRIDNASTS